MRLSWPRALLNIFGPSGGFTIWARLNGSLKHLSTLTNQIYRIISLTNQFNSGAVRKPTHYGLSIDHFLSF